ncbi:isopentenyl pyrophosphate isomerase [Legionella israelensis]|uniref:Isopentenyl-diphosphate delta-isomerase n=2 Tax=Legionella israelensis TaxID=454 RepID=A0A0W0WK45_9GAMM|nr:isopentenyl pyrophosphate isomerase [Legionella israelensis]SCY35587.1 isopentenyl-diphosphate delta-isomerase [Legionella israelensis DSM 19235]STX58676.1 isopentenyl pyrophosphate isomerase [Legionella israelensis]
MKTPGMQKNYHQFEQRKQDHITLALMQANQSSEFNFLDQVSLQHEALPDLNFDDIDISTKRFGQVVLTPFLVSSMTAGHQHAVNINRNLINACAQSGWVMGVGSQRREITDKQAASEWMNLRLDYPDVCLFSNLGIAQLITTPLADIHRLTDALHAQGLIIHCNALQECIQPEGTPQFRGSWKALEQLVSKLHLPVIIKETGCGFSQKTLQRLNDIGVSAVDISGLGGTHWGRIEGHRAGEDDKRRKAAISFANWGIDTVSSVIYASEITPTFEIWGSGGVRNGLDAAKLIGLGASTIGFAKPMLEAALKSSEDVIKLMTSIEYELKVAMFCTGSLTLNHLKEKVCL